MINTAESQNNPIHKSRVLKMKATNMDNLMEKAKEKLKVRSDNIPVLSQAYYSSTDFDIRFTDYLKKYFPSFAQELALLYNNNKGGSVIGLNYLTKEQYASRNSYLKEQLSLFPLTKIYTQDDFYIFESSDWHYYHVKMAEFDTRWLMAPSLKPWKPTLQTKSNIIRNFTLNNTWGSIQLINEWNVISTIVWDLFTIVNPEEWDVIIINNNLLEIMKLDTNWVQSISDTIAHPYWVIQKITIDNNANFLLVISKYDDKTKFHVLQRNTLECIETFDDITDILLVDNKDDVTCLNKDGNVISIDTNFDQFAKWFIEDGEVVKDWTQRITRVEDQTKEYLSKVLVGWWIQVNLEDVRSWNWIKENWSSNDSAIVEQLWMTKIWEDETLRMLFEKAQEIEEIELVYDVFLQIKLNPAVSAVKWISDSIESAINKKRYEIKMRDFSDKLTLVNDDLQKLDRQGEDYFLKLNIIKTRLDELRKMRSQIPLMAKEMDDVLKKLSICISEDISKFQKENSDTVISTIETNLTHIIGFLAEVEYMASLTQVYATEIWKQTENMIELLEDDQKDIYKKKLFATITQRQQVLFKAERDSKDFIWKALKEEINEVKWSIQQLSEILETIDDEVNLDIMKGGDALYLRIMEKIWEFPVKDSEKLILRLNSIFDDRKLKIKLQRLDNKWVVHSLDEYWISTFLYFSDIIDTQVWYRVRWNRLSDSRIRLQLCFDDWTCFDIDRYLQYPSLYADAMITSTIQAEMTQREFFQYERNLSEWKKVWKPQLIKLSEKFMKAESTETKQRLIKQIREVKKYYAQARLTEVFAINLGNKLNLNPRSHLENLNPRFIVLDEEKDLLTKMSRGFTIQKQEQKWIDILEWWPWLGKTEICRFFAAATNREIIRVQCSKMDPSDMFFSPQLRAWETSREPADWIKLMQKPGTIVLYDEIDKLNSESFERLHSLFDASRSVYDPQMWMVRAHPDTLFVGTRNSYEKMSNPIVSRSVIIKVEAPSEMNEAFKVSKYTSIDFFEKMSSADFNQLWTKYVTQNEAPGNSSWEKKVFETIQNIRKLIGILNELRHKQTSDAYEDKFEYELSYRDAEQIFLRYNMDGSSSFKDKIIEILIPKVRAVVYSQEDKDAQEKIAIDIIDEEFK
ncbi:MAG: hypothetical protein ACD_3C00163G0004 [uncultured bacterium (gcode 4)]|uniref:ATPase dynein-related AAA domain-containing protein n=1 Tax=uncultured bacterium (gcode 4) TaxID=1234023 RepID=K2G0Q1_9BACT|nr:MAG: hypothetical protein ACD_3C00163G0004 [uncultured bacterium (gcode 4)]